MSIDTLRADHLSGYGYERETTPGIDRFAAQGTLFVDAISPASWTVPAHMTMLTGLDAPAHGLYLYPDPGRLADETLTLAELLAAEGFRTGAFTGGGYVSPRHGFDRGFETFQSKGRRFSDDLLDAFNWLVGLPKGERFFLFLHGFDVHGPYMPQRNRYRRLFYPDYRGDYDINDYAPMNPRPSDDDLRWVVSQYDGEIRGTDDIVMGFLDEIRAAGYLEETLVVITSDHGEEMFEHGSMEHTHSLYDELVRVPLIFVGPGIPAARVERQVGLIDLFPTLLDLLDVAPRGPFQGRPLFPLDAEPSSERPVFSVVGFSEYPYSLASVRTDRWKLVLWTLSGMAGIDMDAEPDRHRDTYRFRERAEDWIELYDLEADPGETRNVSAEHPDVVRELHQALLEHIEKSRTLGHPPVGAPPPDPAYLEELKALGYGG